MSQEIQLYQQLPTMLPAVREMGTAMAKALFFGCQNTEQGIVQAIECIARGVTPFELRRRYHVYDGQIQLRTSAALADFRRSGGDHEWIKLGDDATFSPPTGYAEAVFTDSKGRKLTYRYSMEDAQREQLLRANSRWQKRPGSMLRARVISNALMALCPEIYAGDDGDDDATPPSKSLHLTQASEPPQVTATAIEVQSSVTPAAAPSEEAELARMGLAPEQTAATAQPSSPPDGGGLSPELVTKLQEAIGGDAIQALAWMHKQAGDGWPRPGQDLSYCSEVKANRVLYAYQVAKGDRTKNTFLIAIGAAQKTEAQ